MNYIKCKTIAQYKLLEALTELGVEPEEISSVELLGLDAVRITGHTRQYADVRWKDGQVEII